MSLRKLFEEDENGNYKSHLGSAGEALLEEKNREYYEENPGSEEDSGMDQMGGLGPNDQMMTDSSQSGAQNERFLDRMIKIRGIPKIGTSDKTTGPWDSPEWLEQLVINSFDKEMSRKIYRAWQDISALSEGDGNSAITQQHSMALIIKTLSQRSRNDFPDIPNERGQWGENRQVHKQINVNRGGNGGRAGFLTRLFGK